MMPVSVVPMLAPKVRGNMSSSWGLTNKLPTSYLSHLTRFVVRGDDVAGLYKLFGR